MAVASNSDIFGVNPKNDYKLLQRIGKGGFGKVYKAIRCKDGLISAVKILEPTPGEDFSHIQQEVLILKSFQHPNIVTYFDSFSVNDELWICMEYCSGRSLQYIYHKTGPLSEQQIAYVCRETLKALKYLHSHHIIHRDIKGANILLTNDGDIKLADFGVSAQISATISRKKSGVGTCHWMAPEVIACNIIEEYEQDMTRGCNQQQYIWSQGITAIELAEKITRGYKQQCDIWSLGITAIELAECKPPLFYYKCITYLMSNTSIRPPFLTDRSKWSPVFQHFIEVSLTVNPESRPNAETLLQQSPFVQGDLSNVLMKELLDIVSNSPKSSIEGVNNDKLSFGPNIGSVGLCGNPAPTQTQAFGRIPALNLFSAPYQQSTGFFNAMSTLETSSTNSFSSDTSMSGGLFGQKPAAITLSSTGLPTQTYGLGGFSSTSTTETSFFGLNKPATSVFGVTDSTFESGLRSGFGPSTFVSSLGGQGTLTSNMVPSFSSVPGTSSFNFQGASNANSPFYFNTLLTANYLNNAWQLV